MSRATYLLVTDINKLSIFGNELRRVFKSKENYGSFLVGSCLEKADYRDVDVRTILSDEDFEQVKDIVDIGALNHLISTYGQQLTGLPIDYQVMPTSSPENEGKKHPIDIFSGYVNGERSTR